MLMTMFSPAVLIPVFAIGTAAFAVRSLLGSWRRFWPAFHALRAEMAELSAQTDLHVRIVDPALSASPLGALTAGFAPEDGTPTWRPLHGEGEWPPLQTGRPRFTQSRPRRRLHAWRAAA
ncbi:MAG TPA: hypothetical protein VN222_04955 [Novosphingobium sp.]|nr:hypothetical protein [Novosphingobium sp.]